MKLSSVLCKIRGKANSKEFQGVIVIVIALSLMFVEECRAVQFKSDKIIATVNGFKIYMSDLERARKQLSPQANQLSKAVVNRLLLDNLVNTHLVAAAARKEGLDKNNKIVDRMRRIEDQILNKFYSH